MRKSKNAKNADAESYIDIMEKNHMEIPWHDYASADSNVLICKAGLIEKASVIGRVGLIMLSCGTGAWRVRTSMNRLSKELGVTCTVDVGLSSIVGLVMTIQAPGPYSCISLKILSSVLYSVIIPCASCHIDYSMPQMHITA